MSLSCVLLNARVLFDDTKNRVMFGSRLSSHTKSGLLTLKISPNSIRHFLQSNAQAITHIEAMNKRTYATTDLCDIHVDSPARLQAAESGILFDFGGIKAFHGQVQTVRCFESNPLVRKTLGEPGKS